MLPQHPRSFRSIAAACAFAFAGLWLFCGEASAAREYGGYYTKQRLAHARANVGKYEWADRMRRESVDAAAAWIQIPDEELWAMVPGQDLPRCIDVTLTRSEGKATRSGCLQCGEKIYQFGNFPYEPDFKRNPWKLTCPSCEAVFPTNDFSAYYQSGMDARGLFNPALADRRLLFNTAHPDPKDPLHLYGVDDGFGFVDHNGQAHRFIGYYVWKHWRWLYGGLQALANAFICTGQSIYAHKAAILLDRIADVYPEMDWKPYADRGWFHSDGDLGVGKIEGAIWETGVVRKFAESYDAILSGTMDDPELAAFLGGQARRYRVPHPKGTRDLFVQNVDEGILRCAYEGILSGQISGNEGMQQMAVASCALALNTNPETSRWLDWLFAPKGGAIPGLLVNLFDHDGMTDEAAPNYAVFGGELISQLADRLAGYPLYHAHDLFCDFPQLRASVTTPYRLAALGVAVPNLGDTGTTGLVTLAPANPLYCVIGFRNTGDPDMAVAAYRANGNSASGLGHEVLSADPEAFTDRIVRLATAAGPRPVGGYLLNGYGLAMLESGPRESGTSLVCNYGRTTHHAHADTLNFDLFAFGNWLAPDFGDPEFKTGWPSRSEWTVNTLSHNTVFVDRRAQVRSWGGKARLFQQLPGFGAFELDGQAAYPQLREYRRTMLVVGAPDGANAYVVDIFRVAGGSDHVYSFHGPPGAIATTGLQLTAQATGTYAGPAVSFAEPSAGRFPLGYSYLYNVRRDQQPPGSFLIEWRAAAGYRNLTEADDVRLRFYALSQGGDVALAEGDPPQNKPGNPRRLGYLLMHRTGENLTSTFVSVIEPYRRQPFIKLVQRLEARSDGQVALRIEFMNGMVDQVLCNPAADDSLQLADGTILHGKIGYLRQRATQPDRAVLLEGTLLKTRGQQWQSGGVITGKVVAMNRETANDGWIVVDTELPPDGSLTGQQIHLTNDNERDATYTIRKVEREGSMTKIHCGPISFIRGYRGPSIILRGQRLPASYTQGYLYDFEPGASFRIPLHIDWCAPAAR